MDLFSQRQLLPMLLPGTIFVLDFLMFLSIYYRSSLSEEALMIINNGTLFTLVFAVSSIFAGFLLYMFSLGIFIIIIKITQCFFALLRNITFPKPIHNTSGWPREAFEVAFILFLCLSFPVFWLGFLFPKFLGITALIPWLSYFFYFIGFICLYMAYYSYRVAQSARICWLGGIT